MCSFALASLKVLLLNVVFRSTSHDNKHTLSLVQPDRLGGSSSQPLNAWKVSQGCSATCLAWASCCGTCASVATLAKVERPALATNPTQKTRPIEMIG